MSAVRHGLIEPEPRKRPKSYYRRWERDAGMALWQLDIVGGVFLADGTEAQIVTGVDDYSRHCVICQASRVLIVIAGALRAGTQLPDGLKRCVQPSARCGHLLVAKNFADR